MNYPKFQSLALLSFLGFTYLVQSDSDHEPKMILEAMLRNEKFTSTINFCRADSTQLIFTDTSEYLMDYNRKKLCNKTIKIETDLNYDYDVNRRRLPTDSNRFLFLLDNQDDTIYFEIYEPWGNGLVGGYFLPEESKVEVTGRGNF